MQNITIADATEYDLFEYNWDGILMTEQANDGGMVITRTDGMQLVYTIDYDDEDIATGWSWAEYEGDHRDGYVTDQGGDAFETDTDIEAAAEFIKEWAAQA